MPGIQLSEESALTGRRVMYIFNLGIPVFLAYTGAMGVAASQRHATDTNKASSLAFQGIYMILFAALLFVYEVIQLAPCETLDAIIKKNFGFLYGVIGRGQSYAGLVKFLTKGDCPTLVSLNGI
jgi:hypothetical protein